MKLTDTKKLLISSALELTIASLFYLIPAHVTTKLPSIDTAVWVCTAVVLVFVFGLTNYRSTSLKLKIVFILSFIVTAAVVGFLTYVSVFGFLISGWAEGRQGL